MIWQFTHDQIAQLQGKRVIEISDGTITYFAAMTPGQRWRSAVEEFIHTYDWNYSDAELAEDLGIPRSAALADLASELRATIRITRHQHFAGISEQY